MVGNQNQQIHIERCFLGHITSETGLLDGSDALKIVPNDFSDQDLGFFWDALKSILPCSSGELLIRLHSKNAKLALEYGLSFLTDRFHFPFEECVKSILAYGQKKRLMEEFSTLFSEIASNHANLSQEDILLRISNFIKNNENNKTDKKTKILSEVADEWEIDFEKRINDYRNGIMPGITTGIHELDDMIYGWTPGSYSIIGARTSMGKTTLALNFADAALRNGKKVMFFTNEVKSKNLVAKHMSKRAKVKGPDIHRGSVSPDDISRINAALGQTRDLPFFLNEQSGRNLEEFQSEVKKHKRQHNIDLVILDYIQQMYSTKKMHSRLEELTFISNSMQTLSNDLNIPIICLAQLNRTAEKSDDIPNISQIRDCGAIEQDADNVILIHRNKNENPNNKGEVTGQLIVGKARDGKTGICPVMINFAHNNFR